MRTIQTSFQWTEQEVKGQNYKDFKAKMFCCEDITAKIIIYNHNIDQLYSKAKRYAIIVTVKHNCNI